MGNVRKWGGPLSQSWHQRSLALQKQIVARLRSFGVTTVLPGFAGHLPRSFKRWIYNIEHWSFLMVPSLLSVCVSNPSFNWQNHKISDYFLMQTWWSLDLGMVSMTPTVVHTSWTLPKNFFKKLANSSSRR